MWDSVRDLGARGPVLSCPLKPHVVATNHGAEFLCFSSVFVHVAVTVYSFCLLNYLF